MCVTGACFEFLPLTAASFIKQSCGKGVINIRFMNVPYKTQYERGSKATNLAQV